jgi:hypothetical protein
MQTQQQYHGFMLPHRHASLRARSVNEPLNFVHMSAIAIAQKLSQMFIFSFHLLLACEFSSSS